jgi:lysophospholipase L1-like esterase
MKKSLTLHRAAQAAPWILAAAAVIAFGASFSELQRIRGRFGEVTRYQDSHRLLYREFVIRSELAQAENPILVIGDSITERAKLPGVIDGHPVINAGIGGATIEDFVRLAPEILQGTKPWLIAVALGANNTRTNEVRRHYAELIARLKTVAPRVVAIGVTPMDGADQLNADIRAAATSEGVAFIDMPIPADGRMIDQIHLNPGGYLTWTPALVAALSQPSS